jgi:hypothetical protein
MPSKDIYHILSTWLFGILNTLIEASEISGFLQEGMLEAGWTSPLRLSALPTKTRAAQPGA